MSEQGHHKNLENFKKERDFAVSWGAKYAPTNPLLLAGKYNTVIIAAEAALDAVINAKTPYRNATAYAQDAFEPLNALITRVINALKSAGVPDSVIEDAKTYSRKIKGQKKTENSKTDPNSPDFDASAKANSASQMSRASRIEFLDNLISLLESQELYKPNEADLTVETLTALSADLKAKTDAVQTAFVALSNARAARNVIFYTKITGLIYIGRVFKIYVKSFGTDSSEWNQIKDLEFRDIKH
jgi:hypothetical protein